VAIDKLPTKMFILNNQHLGMVVQWEDRFYKANRAHTYLGRRVCSPPGTNRVWLRACPLSAQCPAHVAPARLVQLTSCFCLSQEAEYHQTHEETDIYPDFVTIARGFGVPSKRVRHPSELRAAIREMLDTPGPYLLDIMVRALPRGLSFCMHMRMRVESA
jgi:acetolactate synthase I/II/III large subunit